MENTIRQQTDEMKLIYGDLPGLIHNLALIVSVGIMVALGLFLVTQIFGVPK